MSDWKIDPYSGGTWDLVIEGGDFVVVGETSATWLDLVRQRIVYAIMTWLGESPFDRSDGFPWEESVFGKQPLEGIAALLHDKVANVEGVDGLNDAPVLTFERPERRLTISLTALAGEFEVPVSVSFTEAA